MCIAEANGANCDRVASLKMRTRLLEMVGGSNQPMGVYSPVGRLACRGSSMTGAGIAAHPKSRLLT